MHIKGAFQNILWARLLWYSCSNNSRICTRLNLMGHDPIQQQRQYLLAAWSRDVAITLEFSYAKFLFIPSFIDDHNGPGCAQRRVPAFGLQPAGDGLFRAPLHGRLSPAGTLHYAHDMSVSDRSVTVLVFFYSLQQWLDPNKKVLQQLKGKRFFLFWWFVIPLCMEIVARERETFPRAIDKE